MEEPGPRISVGKPHVDRGKAGKSAGGASGGDGPWLMIRYITLFGNTGKAACTHRSGTSHTLASANLDTRAGALRGFAQVVGRHRGGLSGQRSTTVAQA
jgi:hypothetical protein